jgi:MFS superfamily sulfate permease-like transporter
MTNLLNWIAPGVSTILFYDFTPAGLPVLRLPQFLLEDLPSLLGSAAVVALVLFSSGMLTARSFAAKGNYEIDADREFAAFGAENTASARSQGFAVTGADLRTAVAIASGGRTQVTGLVAAATILRQNWALDRIEVGLSVVTTLGVVAFGVINAILVAVILALLCKADSAAKR